MSPRTDPAGAAGASRMFGAWPRLLTVEQAGAYLGVSRWTLQAYIAAGDLPVIRPPRPRSERMLRRARRYEQGPELRRTLIDRLDLDALADAWRHGNTA